MSLLKNDSQHNVAWNVTLHRLLVKLATLLSILLPVFGNETFVWNFAIIWNIEPARRSFGLVYAG
jgi:hypothetical protein